MIIGISYNSIGYNLFCEPLFIRNWYFSCQGYGQGYEFRLNAHLTCKEGGVLTFTLFHILVDTVLDNTWPGIFSAVFIHMLPTDNCVMNCARGT